MTLEHYICSVQRNDTTIFYLLSLERNNFFVYSFLYRGYPYNLLLFAITFYLLSKPNNYKFSNTILVLLSILTFLAPSNILLIFPMIFFYRNIFKFKNIFYLYFCLTPILLCSHIFLNGIYELKEIVGINNQVKFDLNIDIFLSIILIR